MADALEALRRVFVARFGREPGLNESLLIDPDALCWRRCPWMRSTRCLIDSPMASMTCHQGQVLASNDVGYILTEDAMHLFSAYEIDLWEAALGPESRQLAVFQLSQAFVPPALV